MCAWAFEFCADGRSSLRIARSSQTGRETQRTVLTPRSPPRARLASCSRQRWTRMAFTCLSSPQTRRIFGTIRTTLWVGTQTTRCISGRTGLGERCGSRAQQYSYCIDCMNVGVAEERGLDGVCGCGVACCLSGRAQSIRVLNAGVVHVFLCSGKP